MRGNHRLGRDSDTTLRSIPACAGEPSVHSHQVSGSTVYPRVCGGTRCPAGRPPRRTGLSPRVRGNPGAPVPVAFCIRSIPACAGEPGSKMRRPRCTEVYPRVCGGTTLRLSEVSDEMGLSPRVRGNRHRAAIDHLLERSIPACAGEPQTYTGREHPCPVYPRVCGGTATL